MKLTLPTNMRIPSEGAYLVGGSVRDMIYGRRPKDYDIVVANDPQGYAERLATALKGRVVHIGKREFPLYRIVKAPVIIDVTPIKGENISSDLADRDFTINALAYDLSTDKIIDIFGGLADIEQGVVRMVSAQAFQNDPVRLVRAFRMAADFGFDIAPATSRAITSHAPAIQNCAGERIWAELRSILESPNGYNTIQNMAQSDLLTVIFPELAPLKGCRQSEPHHLDVFAHTFLALQSLEGLFAHPENHLAGRAVAFIKMVPDEHKALMKLALLLHDIGKPSKRMAESSGNIHFYGHASASAILARKIFHRLRMSRRQADWVEWIIGNHSRPHDLFLLQDNNNLTPKAIGKFLRQCGEYAPYLIFHALADNLGKNLSHHQQRSVRDAFLNDLLDAYFKSTQRPVASPLVSGDDLMAAFDLQPSPLLGTLLKSIEEARLVGTLSDKSEALDWVEEYLREKGMLPK